MDALIGSPQIRRQVEAQLPVGAVRRVQTFGQSFTFRGPLVSTAKPKPKRGRRSTILSDAALGLSGTVNVKKLLGG